MKDREVLCVSYEYLEKALGLKPDSIRSIAVKYLSEHLEIVHSDEDLCEKTGELEHIMARRLILEDWPLHNPLILHGDVTLEEND